MRRRIRPPAGRAPSAHALRAASTRARRAPGLLVAARRLRRPRPRRVARAHGVDTPATVGSSLADLAAAATAAGLEARPAKLSRAALGALPVPAVVHRHGDHWGAMTARDPVTLFDPAAGPRQLTNARFAAASTGWALVVAGRRTGLQAAVPSVG